MCIFKDNLKSISPFSSKAISLFAGAGGCSLGFSKFGYNIISAYDSWSAAVKTYNQNFEGARCHQADLSILDFDEEKAKLGLKRGELDLILGAPPCQGYTSAGRRDVNDPRNKLFMNYIRALDVFYPKWFVMENVEGILTTGHGDFIVDCVKNMIHLGYSVFIKKIYMQEYGIPQRRKRVIIVGNRLGINFQFPEVIVNATGRIFRNGSATLRDAIGDLEGIDLCDIGHNRHFETGVKLSRIMALKPGQTMKDLPEELQHPSYAKRANRRVSDGVPSEKRGGAPSGLKRLLYAEPSLTITGASTSEFVHPTENRMLTVRECARIQTFPDNFIFAGSENQQEQQIGNAIPPLFANILAESIYYQSINGRQCQVAPGLISLDITKAASMGPALAHTYHRLQGQMHQPALFDIV